VSRPEDADVIALLADMAREYADPGSKLIADLSTKGLTSAEAAPWIAKTLLAAAQHVASGHHIGMASLVPHFVTAVDSLGDGQ